MTRHVWTEADDAIIRLRAAQGVDSADTAMELGVSRSAVRNRSGKIKPGHRSVSRTLEERFLDHVQFEPNSGCWLWEGSLSRQGYGQLRLAKTGKGALKVATHISLALYKQPVPVGLNALHRCDNPPCVNPDHLFVGTLKENTRDSMSKGRNSPPPKAKKGQGIVEICKRGHPRSGDNLYLSPAGHRQCRDCLRFHKRTRRARLKSEGLTSEGTIPRVSA